MKILILSDTHNKFPKVNKTYDIVFHLGDATNKGSKQEIVQFSKWFSKIKAKHKIFIPGNNDLLFYRNIPQSYSWLEKSIKVIIHDYLEIDGIKFFCSSYTKKHSIFKKSNSLEKTETELDKIFKNTKIKNVHICLTHNPCYGIFDKYIIRLGSKALNTFMYYLNPQLHVFGHIHNTSGLVTNVKGTVFKNVAKSSLVINTYIDKESENIHILYDTDSNIDSL